MPTDWRQLFDEVGVHWVDRGPNARRGNVNIKCPLCADDPSEHMLVSEEGVGYYCHRNPQQHSGRNMLSFLHFVLPRRSHRDLLSLFNRFTSASSLTAYQRPTRVPTNIEQAWGRFRLAADDDRYLDYLYNRGFTDPAALCRRYDLRYSPVGEWAMRLLIPISSDDGEILSWTGRALRSETALRYKTLAISEDLLYVPRPMRATGIVVEGPMDALKLAAATEQMAIGPAAMLGMNASAARLHRLDGVLRPCQQWLICFDSTVMLPTYRQVIIGLALARRSLYIGRLRLPGGYEDAGAIPQQELTTWLSEQQLRNWGTPQ